MNFEKHFLNWFAPITAKWNEVNLAAKQNKFSIIILLISSAIGLILPVPAKIIYGFIFLTTSLCLICNYIASNITVGKKIKKITDNEEKYQECLDFIIEDMF